MSWKMISRRRFLTSKGLSGVRTQDAELGLSDQTSFKILFCWGVYDVTKFLEDHPGGDDVLLSATGKDATDDFEDVGHSNNAREMMEEYYVGSIDSSTIPTKREYTPPKQPHYNQDKTSDFIIKLLQFLVPLAILGLAVGIRFYTKSA
ncbi:hypothetical protein HHK36_020319 [Tetracentron sinense]|uniref:Cytochrome b5 heme-binding domain-containing protein n=1 Tax=Tetracentron sinense TaxID=13715 RepID=A0A835DBI6_TETSI|nr:hypothetical protein HHK36_020319 [Tetracentron sinense]